MANIAAGIAIAFLTVLVLKVLLKYLNQLKFAKNYCTPGFPFPILGHSYLFFSVNKEDILETLLGLTKCDPDQRKIGAIIGNEKLIWYFHPEPVEEILSSNTHISKSEEYKYLEPWLGTGLLLSTHSKWRQRRKLLTPGFHFRILEDALEVFNAQGLILADVLREDSLKGDGVLNIFPYVTRCTLDVILETAMGQKLNIQTERRSDYCDTINAMVHVVQQRQLLPWLQSDTTFALSPLHKSYVEALATLQEFTANVIKAKRAEERGQQPDHEELPKGRIAFIDILLGSVLPDGSRLTDSDIQEEVDTFLFEGHDTTACAISWTLFLLGKHPEIMKKVYDEQMEVFDGDADAQVVTTELLAKMKYLECCIKEALRLYPSVPIIGRSIESDGVHIDGQPVERGSTAIVFVHLLHRNPTIWPRPDEFIPERFIDSSKRHPYAYVPFSAGPRNCIGQRFAMMEEKTILSHILRRLHFQSMDERVKPVIEIITRPFGGVRSKIKARNAF